MYRVFVGAGAVLGLGLGGCGTVIPDCDVGEFKTEDGQCAPIDVGLDSGDAVDSDVTWDDGPDDTADDSGWGIIDETGDSWQDSWVWDSSSWQDSWTWDTSSWQDTYSWQDSWTWDSGGDSGTLALMGWSGEATLTPTTYTGTESLYLVEATGTIPSTGAVLCEYTQTATGVAPSAVTAPCTDDDGTACDWTYDVELTNAVETVPDCSLYFTGPPADASMSYGFHGDFQSAGYSYGPALMWYYAGGTSYSGGWYPASLGYGTANVDTGTQTFSYDWPWAYYVL